ncbi:MAG: hypothetical protein KDK96_11690 [Chlamydiia bacterium]|nr:hypothetical protein [Chlamydiia bacterium]
MSEDYFRLYKLFEKNPKVSLSVKEIADFYGIPVKVIREWIQEDIRNGMFFKDPNCSNYYLSQVGFEKLYALWEEATGMGILKPTGPQA